VQHPPASAYVLAANAAERRGRAANCGPRGRSCVQRRSGTMASSTHSQARSNRPRTLSTGGMSYGKLPSGACGLIRLLRVSRLANRHAPSRTYRRVWIPITLIDYYYSCDTENLIGAPEPMSIEAVRSPRWLFGGPTAVASGQISALPIGHNVQVSAPLARPAER
jgi:hypothetical protein